ncbi:type II toxin-antitoxin system RelE/ParE family toxin [Gracilimonas mengyeensis]|uniref:Plasmid stabilization system protein ParE n=1 Tax=Gracilimonas mengyeensis TaxID=1302730 RepID=A0A521AYS4_9BACT|nr:type II toxin-antitoxin system RelE/ParE family toxin [Gracilimonas mengyeensis]SMO39984.1 Plasmid stabilization system protein ParE [Gracilimonas mengyeensis]
MDDHNFSVRLTEESKENYQQIKTYLISEFGVQVFNFFSEKFLGSLSLISVNPHLFPVFDKAKNIHKAVIRKEVSIFYEINEKENEVIILSIFDNRKDTPDF